MKAMIEEGCIGCSLCTASCPQVFEMGDEGVAVVICEEIPEEIEEEAQTAADQCPVSVIAVE